MKQVITTIQAGVEGFSPIDTEFFTLYLRLGESVISLPLSREAIKELAPRWGQLLFIDLCIPGEPDAPAS